MMKHCAMKWALLTLQRMPIEFALHIHPCVMVKMAVRRVNIEVNMYNGHECGHVKDPNAPGPRERQGEWQGVLLVQE